jgi:processing peptidase subunit alpha
MLSIYNDSSIFGIYGTCYPSDGGELVRILVDECIAMAGAIDETSLERAKRQLRSSVWMHLESRAVQLEDVGRQVCYNIAHLYSFVLCVFFFHCCPNRY